ALAIERAPAHKRMWLYLALAGNLLPLALFKYLDFAIRSYNQVSSLWLAAPVSAPSLGLPIGISFFTFMGLSYTIDVYRGELRAPGSWLQFMAFLSLFPHLVAGPILRASHLLPQLAERRRVTGDDLWEGTRLVVSGFFKKLVVADGLAGGVDA